MQGVIGDYFEGHRRMLDVAAEQLPLEIEQVAKVLIDALVDGRKVLIMGNGGSAADAQHFAAELVGRFLHQRQGLPALALTTDSSILTAVGNDYGFRELFARQVEALAASGDVVVGISTSGNSENVLRGFEVAKQRACRTVALLGRDGGDIHGQVELALTVAVDQTPHIQEGHAVIIHLLCLLIDKAFSSRQGEKG
ncbi:MAG: phosphoheptose isomerase [Desulfuromonas sp.]|nr:MAG: phosphoheptose isomerase [Desulfuromonas sp.]